MSAGFNMPPAMKESSCGLSAMYAVLAQVLNELFGKSGCRSSGAD